MAGILSTSYPKIIEDSEFWSDVESLTTPGLTGRDLAIDFVNRIILSVQAKVLSLF